MKLSIFRGSSPDSSVAAPTARLVIDRVEGSTVVGWAAGPDGGPCEIELLIDGQRCDARVQAMHRQDVLNALQLTSGASLGFRLHLPHSIWKEQDGSARAVQLRAQGQLATVDLPAHVTGLVETFRQGVRPAEAVFVALAWHLHQLGSPTWWPSTLDDWLQAEVRFCGGWPAIGILADHPGAEPEGRIEGIDRGLVQGWTRWDCLGQETIGLRCGGEPIDCSVIRIDRADVQQALKSNRRSLGLEIELPATMWQRAAADGSVTLSVHVGGRRLGEAFVLTRDDLTAWLDHQRGVEAALKPGESAEQRRERQYATLLVLEHVAAAGLWAALDGPRRDFLAAQARRYGMAAPADVIKSAAPVAAAESGGDDYATVMVWRLLRDFNTRLNADATQPVAALQQVLADGPSVEGIVQRFLWSVIPYFCSQGQYAALRPHLDAGRLRRLVASKSSWELSLVLPEAAAGGDFRLAHQAMEKIAAGSAGWLNTDCIATAVELALRNEDPALEQAIAVTAFVDAFIDLLQTLGRAGYWSRLHDANLIASTVQLLAHATDHDENLAVRAEQVALRCYGLVPDFWRRLDATRPPVGGWSAGLKRARSSFEHLREALADPARIDGERLDSLAFDVAWLRAADNMDVEIIARELGLALASRRPAQSLAHGPQRLLQGRNDLLRLVAQPASSADLRALGEADDLAQEIRESSGVAWQPRQTAMTALVQRCLGPRDDGPALAPDESSVLRSFAHRPHHFVGVRLACADWLRGRRTADSRQRDEGLVALRDLWMRAFESCVDLPHPPAALMATTSLLDAALQDESEDALARVVAEMRRLLRQRYGEAIALSEARHCAHPQWADAGAGHSTLVAVYSCRRNLPTRIRAIRESWGRDLDALGIPWLVVVGDGDDTLQDDILALAVSDAYEALPSKTLALVDWVWRHTRFEHLLKIDDDCHLAVEAYFAAAPYLAHHYHGRRLHRGVGGTDRVWHQSRSSTERAAKSADKSPEPSIYADGGAAYCLSRHAMGQVVQALQTTSGARLKRSSYLEDKLLGDLLASRGIGLSNEGHFTLIRRRFGAGASPVNAYDNLFYPSRKSPTLVTHLDGFEDLAAVQAGQPGEGLRPARLWPTHAPARLGGAGTNQLELLSPESRVAELNEAPLIVIAVARNECVLAPHFLKHYRALGVRHFVFVDNLSDDGTREYLAQQPDVVLYSADTDYKHSHFGVSWQQAVLGAHALGKWVVLADLDEFLVYPDCENRPIEGWLAELDASGHDAARVLMVDMYPQGPLDEADFTTQAPFDIAASHEAEPTVVWHLGSGAYSNGSTHLSALRHRLIPDSAPNLYTSQKIAVFRYQPWVRLTEGLHYASNLRPAAQPVWFAHFKYHAGFRRKVETEVARRQHFNDAEEYKKYAAMLAEARSSLYEPGVSVAYGGSRSWAHPA